MVTLKEILLGAYYASTLPARRRAARERAQTEREPVRILFYHRVADQHPNDWTMRSATFANQIRWLRKRFDLVTLAEAQERITSGRNQRPTACITFDDGYADNCRGAIPLLLKYRIPFTYFVSTDHVLRGQPFPHDVKAGRPLAVNTLKDLRAMAAAGVEIGAHTRSHANLGAGLSTQQITDEMVGSKRELENSLGIPVRYFAFPYGLHENLSVDAFQIAQEAGFWGVCSAYGGYNFPGDDPFHLRRFHADPEFIRFLNWMTVDPRKLQMHRDFDPGDYRAASNVETKDTVPLLIGPESVPVISLPTLTT
jgi:peptidoglycan/xylan/chitin deacetylase (PgdA/CDA1 family)